MEDTAGGWNTEHHDPHAHHHHESSDRRFSVVLYEAVVQHVTYVTDFCRVGSVVKLSWGTTPRHFQLLGTGVEPALNLSDTPGKRGDH